MKKVNSADYVKKVAEEKKEILRKGEGGELTPREVTDALANVWGKVWEELEK